jgi:hypothetical protein
VAAVGVLQRAKGRIDASVEDGDEKFAGPVICLRTLSRSLMMAAGPGES